MFGRCYFNNMSVQYYKDNSKNESTTHATECWYRNYCKWAEKSGHRKDLENCELVNLNEILETYFAETMRKDGKHYEPSSLANL